MFLFELRPHLSSRETDLRASLSTTLALLHGVSFPPCRLRIRLQCPGHAVHSSRELGADGLQGLPRHHGTLIVRIPVPTDERVQTWGQQNTPEEGVAQLNEAFDVFGVNFLDTAEMYPVPTRKETQGDTDRVVARWLAGRDRSKVILATKVSGPGITWLPGRDGKSSRVTAREIELSVDFSLQRLGTDYIDLLQIHWPDRYVPLFGAAPYNFSLEREAVSFEEQLTAMDKLIKSGKVRYFGVSNETPYGVMKFAAIAEKLGLPKLISIQNSYSLITRSDYEAGLVEVCSPRNENVGLLAYSPLAGGILTGKYSDPNVSSGSRLNIFPGYMQRFKQSLCVAAVDEYSRIAVKHGLTPAELALAWCYSQPHVASTSESLIAILLVLFSNLTQLSEPLLLSNYARI